MRDQRSAWAEAGRRTYGMAYWSVTAVLTLITVVVWVWGDQHSRLVLSVLALVHVFFFGAVHQRRMNRIAREREAREREEFERDSG